MIVKNVKGNGCFGIKTTEELETALCELGVHMYVDVNGVASIWIGAEDYGDAPGRRFGLSAVLQEWGKKVRG